MLATVKRFLQIPPSWSDIRRLGNSNLAKMTILVPIIGYLIIFNNDVVNYLKLSSYFIWNNQESENNKLFYIYFGLSSVGVASFLFQLFCPRSIRVHSHATEYVEHGMVLVSKRRIQRIVTIIDRAHKKMTNNGDWIPPQTLDFISKVEKRYQQLYVHSDIEITNKMNSNDDEEFQSFTPTCMVDNVRNV